MKTLKKPLLVLLVLISLIGLSGFTFYKLYLVPLREIKIASNQLKSDAKFDKNIVDTIFKYTNKNSRNSALISFAIIENSEIYFYGIHRKNDALTTIDTKDSLFQIGSISKVFTSTILANLIINNEINPEETIDKYLGFNLKNDLKIKIKDLSNHTSGLDRLPKGAIWRTFQNYRQPYITYSDTWMLNYLKNEIEIDKSKLGKSEYSNLGVAVLGNVMALNQKMSFENLFNKYIIQNYGLKNSFIYTEKDVAKLVKSYDSEDSITVNWDLKSFSPCGGVVSNIQDMAKFALIQLDEKNLASKLTQKTTVVIDTTIKVGLGWHIPKNKLNHNVIWHNGATGNFTSSMSVDLDSKKSIIILSNIEHGDIKGNLDKLNFAILNYLNTK